MAGSPQKQAGQSEAEEASPQAELWTKVYLAQHHDRLGDTGNPALNDRLFIVLFSGWQWARHSICPCLIAGCCGLGLAAPTQASKLMHRFVEWLFLRYIVTASSGPLLRIFAHFIDTCCAAEVQGAGGPGCREGPSRRAAWERREGAGAAGAVRRAHADAGGAVHLPGQGAEARRRPAGRSGRLRQGAQHGPQ